MRTGLAWLGVVAASVASGLAAWLAFSYFFVIVCGVSDTGGQFPADASPQGWVCHSRAEHFYLSRPVIAFAVSGLFAVVLLVLLWRRTSSTLRWLSPLVLLVVPMATVGVLSLPPDECSASAQRTEPAHACRATNE